jgi:hypothetical protein
MKRLLFALVLLFASFTGTATAETTVAHYREVKAHGGLNWSVLVSYLQGVTNGYVFASAYSQAMFKRPLFCVPDALTLQNQNVIDIIDSIIKSSKATDDGMVEELLFFGIQSSFPCTKKDS